MFCIGMNLCRLRLLISLLHMEANHLVDYFRPLRSPSHLLGESVALYSVCRRIASSMSIWSVN